jgi:hypothetical protein
VTVLQHLIDDPELVDEIFVIIAIGRGRDLAGPRARTTAMLRHAINDGITGFELSSPLHCSGQPPVKMVDFSRA